MSKSTQPQKEQREVKSTKPTKQMLADKTFLQWLPNCSLLILFPSCPFGGKKTSFSDTINTAQHHNSLLV